jgi:hypothetical protein
MWDFTLQSRRTQTDTFPVPIKPQHNERSKLENKPTEYKRFEFPVPSEFPPGDPSTMTGDPPTPSTLNGEATADPGEANMTPGREGASDKDAASCKRSSRDDMKVKEEGRGRKEE